ncbi:C-type lectin-like [Neocloeon triangulifer]|uniref:C-type lectin-like n=1 Tax=Neocloeon triangulifer TaxID=2078957 RepID=UPI00286F7046|nr:C-type lectin-like [Neocloeon triangulifer]
MQRLKVLLGAICVLLAISRVSSVTDEWITFKGGKYMMKVLSEPDTWHGALKQCRNQGYDLLTIETETEHEQVVVLFGQYITDRMWIGGSDLGKEGSFYWYTSGAPVNVSAAWHRGEPSGIPPNSGPWNKEDCMQYYNNKGIIMWNDSMCSKRYPFICEYYDPCAKRSFVID